jgi:hypothetical protein
VWSFYEEHLSPSLKAQVDARNAVSQQPPSVGFIQSDEIKAARLRYRSSPKEFACFLSHQKEASCTAAEASLVKQELESLLEAKVFLGKYTPSMRAHSSETCLMLSPIRTAFPCNRPRKPRRPSRTG